MKQQVLIDCNPQETRVAILTESGIDDLYIERRAERGLVCNVYKGKVVRVLPGMQSAFIDIGLERTAFLHVNDIEAARQPDGSIKPIEYVLHAGDSILVQVNKDPIGTKGARLTTTISLAGHRLVYLPREAHIGVSARIDEESERVRLKQLLTEAIPEDEKGGYIVRTCAGGATREDFDHDIGYLKRLWEDIRKKAEVSAAPTLLYQDLFLEERALRDMVKDDVEEVIVDCDNEPVFDALKAFGATCSEHCASVMKRHDGELPLFEQVGIDAAIEEALSRRVNLKSGGYLVFDQTEAMTTIDVNTGAFVGRRDFSDTIFKTNLEAARVIARQLRLRSLGGIIIVDFIDMKKEDHRKAVLAELKKAVETDRVRTSVSNFSELGLIEITRKRMRDSLSHTLCEPCPLCGGRGEIKTARTVCYQILREIVRELRQYPGAKEFTIIASTPVIDLFLEEEAHALELLQMTIERPVSMQVENTYGPEEYDITFS